MDISEIDGVYERNLAGYPPYHPHVMVKVLFYAYCTAGPGTPALALAA